jgi:hypothetical protein
MGYRSEVAIMIYGTDEVMEEVKALYDTLYNALDADTKKSVDYLEYLMGNETTNGFSEGGFLFHAEDIKWYDGFSHIEFFKELFNQANDIGASGEFIRIGEDLDDIDTNYTGDDNEYRLGVTRLIDGI